MGTLRRIHGNEVKGMSVRKLDLDYRTYCGLVNNICREISLTKWRPDYIVGLVRGGALPAVMISHYFDVPCYMLKVSLREQGGEESNLWMAEDAFGIVPEDHRATYSSRWDLAFRKNILIVDDINDSGATLNWILKDWPSGCFPGEKSVWKTVWNNNVKFAVVVDNIASGCKVKMDFSGKEINKVEDDVWVDFPYEKWWV